MCPEGIIQYKLAWDLSSLTVTRNLRQLIQWRNRLHRLRLIGVTADGVGFGNISIRPGRTHGFLITGSQTGHLLRLNARHCTWVTDYDCFKNRVACRGPVKASSESLTHGAIYSQAAWVHAVIHVHHDRLWRRLFHKLPTTSGNARYGTPSMAKAVKKLLSRVEPSKTGIIIMGGHAGGILVFGSTLESAGEVLLKWHAQI